MTKLVVCSDAHADWVTYGVSRREEVEDAFLHAARAAIEADAFVFLGDLSDPEDGLAAGHSLHGMLSMLSPVIDDIPKIGIPGNHDVYEDGSGESVLSPLEYIDGWHLFKRPSGQHDCCGGKFDLLALPYVASSHAKDVGEYVREFGKRRANRWANGVKKLPLVVIGHLSLPGVVPGEETKEMPRGREVVFPYEAVAALEPMLALNGHYHERQVFKAPHGLRIHIPGSMARLTIDQQQHEPAFLVVEF